MTFQTGSPASGLLVKRDSDGARPENSATAPARAGTNADVCPSTLRSFWGTPFSFKEKSAGERSATGCPYLSVTITSIETRRTLVRRTGADAGGACWLTAGEAARMAKAI